MSTKGWGRPSPTPGTCTSTSSIRPCSASAHCSWRSACATSAVACCPERAAELQLVVHGRVCPQVRARGLIGTAQLRGLAGTVEEEEGLPVGVRRPDALRDLRADQAGGRHGAVVAAL